jgi:hypothetical protein
VRDAEVDKARFLMAADDVDRHAERTLCLAQEFARVPGDAESVGADRAHRRGMHTGQALAEARQALQRRAHRGLGDAPLFVEAGAKSPVSRHVSRR